MTLPADGARARASVTDGGGPLEVVVVDDYPAILLGVQAAARQRPDQVTITRVGTTLADVACGLAQVDVVLLDVMLADGSDVRANVRALSDHGVGVVAFAGSAHADLAAAALDAGASAVAWKHDPLDQLFERLLSQRAVAVDGAPGETRRPAVPPVPLSEREIAVLQMVLRGLVTKQIARALGVETSTVKEYLKRIRKKYAAQGRPATTRTDLVRRAVEDGILERP